MLVDNTCTFKHVYKVRVFQNGALNNILTTTELSCDFIFKKNKAEHWISCGAHAEEGLDRVSTTSSQQQL